MMESVQQQRRQADPAAVISPLSSTPEQKVVVPKPEEKKKSSGPPPRREDKKQSWMYATLPFNIAIGPVSTFVQIYIFQLHGTAIDQGLVITLSNAVSIPAAIVWGFLTDRFHQRKPIIVGSYSAVAVVLVAYLFVDTISGTALLYVIFSFVSTAGAAPLNLLVMETRSKSKWASAFAHFSMISSVGTTLGLALSAAWRIIFPLQLLVIPLSAFSLSSAILAAILISEPSFVFERDLMVMDKRSFYQRLLALPLIFLRIPRAVDFKSVFKGLRFRLTSQVPVLYLSIFAFYVSSGVFNTSLAPSLLSAGVSESGVFLVSFAGGAIQMIAFHFAGPYIEKRTLKKTALGGLALRSSCYAMLGISAFLLTGTLYLGTALVFYPLAAGLAYAAYYTASNTMIFNTLGKRNPASRLGVYSALVGIATMSGSLVSGLVSFYVGYYATFIVAAFCLAAAAVLTSMLSTNGRTEGHE